MRNQFKKSLLCAASLTLLSHGAAMGQETPDASTDDEEAVLNTVTVTGIRQSLDEARSIKRNTDQFVDAIVASDIGKLPDSNVAESLARVSGVQVDRGIGEGSDISIRGLRQNVILYNGRQITDATGRGGNGLDQLQTSTYGLLALVPSEQIGRLEVTKLAAADDLAGGLGGIVDIVSRKPFDKSGQQIALSAGLTHDELPGEDGHELFGLYSNTFANDTFGLLVSATLSERTLGEEGLNTFSGYGVIADNSAPLTDSMGNPVSNDPNGDGNSGFFNLDPRLQQIDETRERDGFSAIAQWRPSSNVELTADIFYSSLEADRDRRWIGYFAGFGPHRNVQFNSDEILTSGIVTRPIQTNVEFADVTSEIMSSAIGGEWEVSDTLKLSGEVSVTNSESTYDQLFFRLQSNSATDITYDQNVGDFGAYSFPNDLTDATGLNLAIMFDQNFAAETDDVTIRGDADWTLSDTGFTSIEAGFRHQDLDTDNTQLSVDIRPGIPATSLGGIIGVFSNPDYLSGELPGVPRTYLTAIETAFTGCESLNALFDATQQAACANPQDNPNSTLNSFNVAEQLTDFYVKANFETVISGKSVSGNVGGRFVTRELTSTGNQLFNGAITPNVFEREDEEFLPSAVARVDLSDDLILRVGAARVLAFPNTEALNNGLQLFGDFRGRGGSPDLDPFLADQFDVSLEYYFNEDSLLSAGLFYKDVDTFIVASTQQETIPGFAQPFSIARQQNGEGATVSGLEILYQQPFTFLPEPFDGFGVIATYSYIDSETPITDSNGRNLPLPGLSENNINLVGYYEKGPFSGRLAYNWRDEYVQGLGPADTGVFFDTYSDLSATASWDFNQNFKLGFEALNLLDSQLETYNAVPSALRTNVEYGRVFKAKISATF